MMFRIKKLKIFTLIFGLVTFLPTFLLPMDGDIDLDKLLEDFITDIPDSKVPPIKSMGEITDFAYWRKTAGARSRDPLYLIPSKRMIFDKNGIDCIFFYNMTGNLSVRPDMAFNVDALNVFDKFTSGEMGEDFPSKDLGPTFETLFKTLPYIRMLTAQERRIGAMLSAGFTKNRVSFQVDQPIMLVERNYWIDNKTQRKELQEVLSKLDGVGTDGAYKIKFGLGDTKLKLGYNIAKNSRFKSAIGVSATLPTSKLFDKNPTSIVKSRIGGSRDELLTDLLNVAKHIVIDPKLGTGHWAVGGFWEFNFGLVPNKLDLWGRLTYDYLFPGSEYRFMPSKRVVPATAFMDLVSSESVPDDFPINDLFPALTKTTVNPGSIFNATVGVNVNAFKNLQCKLGYDFYLQQAEKISKIRMDMIDLKHISIIDAVSPRAIQHKVFGEVDYTVKGKGLDWRFALGGDYTFANEGIARDWTIFAKIGINF